MIVFVCLFFLHVVTCSKLFYCCVVSSVLAVLKLASPRTEDEKSSERNGVEYCKHKPSLDLFFNPGEEGYKVRIIFRIKFRRTKDGC